MKRRLACALTLWASLAAAQTKIALEERLWVASKIYASIPLYFAHWQGVRDFDLDAVYKQYLKAVTAADSRWDFDLLTLEFMARLRNGHTGFEDTFLDRAAGGSLGFSATPIEGKWTVVDTFIDSLKIGDVIEGIDKVSINDFFADKRRYIAASSEATAARVLFFHRHLFPQQFRLHLAGGANVAIDRATQQVHPHELPVTEARWLQEPSLAYIAIRSFADPKHEQFALDAITKFKNAGAVIFDVRGNGGGSTPENLLGAIMDRPYRDWSQSSALSIGLFRAYASLAEALPPEQMSERSAGFYAAFSGFAAPQIVTPGALIQPHKPIYRGKIVVLTDLRCASACEDFAMPLKYSGRATLVGERTWGSSGQPFFYNFGNGMSFRISSKRMTFPDGTEFEGVGIAPDVEVKPSVADRRGGKDPVLERAIRLASELRAQ